MERLRRKRDVRRGHAPPGASSALPQDGRGPEDLRLVRRALARDPLAVEHLTERLQCLSRILRHHARRLRRPIPEADLQDLAQDTAFALWRKLDRFDGRASLETWAYRFCTLQLLAFLRRSERRMNLVGEPEVLEDALNDARSDGRPEPTVDLETALATLDEEELEVVRAKHFDALTFEAVGTRIGASANTAKTRYYRALLKLRGHLQGRYPELFGTTNSGAGSAGRETPR